MLTLIVIVLLALWLLGLVTSCTIGGLIHVLLVVAVIVVWFASSRERTRWRE